MFYFVGFLALASLVRLSAAESSFGLAAQLFQLAGSSAVDNAKLRWALVSNVTSYQVLRSVGSGSYSQIASVTGDSYDDYDLSTHSSYSYKIAAMKGSTSVAESDVSTLQPFKPSGSYDIYDNVGGSNQSIKSDLEANGVYYQYNYEQYPNGSVKAFVEQTSTNGYDFTGHKVILTGQDICASVNYSCLLQRITFVKNPATGDFVMWAHLENTQNYDLAQVAVAYGKPGKNFTFAGTFRPLGYQSRDESIFVDGDDCYLISATDENTNMNIYSMTSNWTAIANLTKEVYINDYREAPSMIKNNGWYYLYTSRAAGWYPSQPEFIASTSITGHYTNPVVVGNTATFASQSGTMTQLTNGQWVMISNVWAANWNPAAGPNIDLFLPAAFSASGGYCTYNYYAKVAYSDNITTANQAMYGIQSGKIVSNYKNATSNAGTKNIGYANNGVQDNVNQMWVPKKFPFYYQIDLGAEYQITEVDLTTNLYTGSETYYQFNVTGSADGKDFTLLANQMKNTVVGFVPSFPSVKTPMRYVRLDVMNITNTIDGDSATWAAGLDEVTVYGV